MAWNVYRLENETLREAFAGLTDKDIGSEFELNQSVPPKAIAHWDFGAHKVRLRAVRGSLSRHEAREFIRGYDGGLPEGWTLHKAL